VALPKHASARPKARRGRAVRSVVVHDIAEFLATVPPFDALDAEGLEAIAAQAEIEFFAAGAVIVAQGAAPLDAVRVVRRGGVEVVVDDASIDLLGEGDVLGYASMLAGLPATVGFRAAEDTLAYRLPDESVRELFARPEGLRYVVRQLDAFDQRRLDAPRPVESAQRPVGMLLRGPAVLCEPETPVREAARQATTAGSSAIVVPLADGTFGIVTDRDLRSRVIAAGLDGDTPLRAVMSAPAYTATADQLGSEVLLDMLDRGVRHFPVLSSTGQVMGVVSDIELLAVEHRTPFHLRSTIARATTIESVEAIIRQLPATTVALHDARVAPSAISGTLTVILDAALRRLLDLAVAEEGPPPCPFTWLALGSHARREVVPSSDLDSAIAWVGDDEDPAMRAYVGRVAERVAGAMARGGVRPCEDGATATRPAFARSLDSWLGAVASWQDDPTRPQALILASVIAEAQPVWGMHAGAPMVAAFRDARRHPQLLRGLARLALAHRPPTGFLRDIVVEHSGEHAGRLDLKRGGVLPIVDLARYAGLAAGVTSATTRDRLRTAATAGTLPTQDARTLESAFDLVCELRLSHQVEQLRVGLAPDDHLDPATLDRLTRTYLRDAFRAISKVQKRIASDLDLRVR
jgi:CBS domain-containing protein